MNDEAPGLPENVHGARKPVSKSPLTIAFGPTMQLGVEDDKLDVSDSVEERVEEDNSVEDILLETND